MTRTATATATGFTMVDYLIVKAGVECVNGEDYTATIALARDLARLAEKVDRDAYQALGEGARWVRLDVSTPAHTAA